MKSSSSLMLVAVQLFFFFSACTATNSMRKLGKDASSPSSYTALKLQNGNDQVVIDNGIFKVTFLKPEGKVAGIKYGGINNLLNGALPINERGYWDVTWNALGTEGFTEKVVGRNFTIIHQDDDTIEVSFSRIWTSSEQGKTVPLNVDHRYIVRRGVPGLYLYSIMEREQGWPDVDMNQLRVVFKLEPSKFHYMALTDDRQRLMPSADDFKDAQPLAYKEAVRLIHAKNPELRGEVEDKYQYSIEDRNNTVHGWISNDPPVGFWMITPSDEFRNGGPVKQDLTSHAGPTMLNMFISTHYAGMEMDTEYRNGEPWKKVFGPVFAYFNTISDGKSNSSSKVALWEAAKKQMLMEIKSWPYNFTNSKDFPRKELRGTVSGQLLIEDKYLSDKKLPAKAAFVGLAPPGLKGSWQRDTKGYQFWAQADKEGYFSIENIRPGNYSLNGWVPGVIGDYIFDHDITITEGSDTKLGALVYWPPRNGPTLWEIGYPDRTAAEFFIPDPSPNFTNKLYRDHEKFRQYGLWDRYTDLHPHSDQIFTVGVDDYTRNWFYAQVTRCTRNQTYSSTTWQIKFQLENVRKGNYTLQLALASAHYAGLQVRFNDENVNHKPQFSTGLIGQDNAIARHGIHGLYRMYSVQVEGSRINKGNNAIFLRQTRGGNPFSGLMYDYIRLESPPS